MSPVISRRTPALDYLARLVTFSSSSQGPYGLIWEFEVDRRWGSITLEEDQRSIVLHTIDIDPSGGGSGTKIILALRDYVDICGKELVVPGVMNLDFFSRFKFLSWREPEAGCELWYASYLPN